MTHEQFTKALDIIIQSHTTKISVNMPRNNFVGNIGMTEFRLHITECVPAVINRLITAGFVLRMTSDGLEVDKL